MAATYLELFDLQQDATFAKRVKFVYFVVSRDIRNESVNVTNHANRLTFANRYIAGTLQKVNFTNLLMEILMSGGLAANGALATDADLFSAAFAALPFLVAQETA